MPKESPARPGKTAAVKEKRFLEISGIDRELLHLISRRAELLRREGSWRRSKNMSKVDPQLEKNLRASWENAGEGLGLDPRLSRQVFGLVNQFALQAGKSSDTGNSYNLAPGREPANARIEGPRSRRLSRMWAIMAASAGQELSLKNVPDSGPVKDFAKALMQAGAPNQWDGSTFELPACEGLQFENAMIFAGDDPVNFYLLLAFALGHMGRSKFTGQPALQMLDLAPLNKMLPKIGARLAAMNPNNPGLPVRLESGGPMDEEIDLPAGVDAEFAGALALAAWSFPGGLTIKSIPAHARPAVADAVSVLNACGIEASLEKNTCTVSDGIPEVPQSPRLSLDVELASALLALPAFSNGSVTVNGDWPESDMGRIVLQDLEAMGIEFTTGLGCITATYAGPRQDAAVTMGVYPGLYPLALALGLKRGTASLEGTVPDVAVELLDRMEADYEITEDRTLTLNGGELEWEGSWCSPDVRWTLACALIAYVRPHIGLENHGELTVIWPQFWNFYNTLPTGRMKPRPSKEEPNDVRRRIKVRS